MTALFSSLALPLVLQFAAGSGIGTGQCSQTDCGANSPVMGTELDLSGQSANEQGTKFEEAWIQFATPPNSNPVPVKLSIDGHELVVQFRGREIPPKFLEGRLYFSTLREVAGQASVRSVTRLESVREVPFWSDREDKKLLAPVYRFSTFSGDEESGEEPTSLCPLPTTELVEVPSTIGKGSPHLPECRRGHMKMRIAGILAGGSAQKLPQGRECDTDYHALLFSGDRYDGRRIMEPGEGSPGQWFNIACKGTAPYKMHLSGHTTAARKYANETLTEGVEREIPREQKQAMLNAITGSYCGPKGPALTVHGQYLQYEFFHRLFDPSPRRMSAHVMPLSIRGDVASYYPEKWTGRHISPKLGGAFEAVWDSSGARCINLARRSPVLHEMQSIIAEKCGMSVGLCDAEEFKLDSEKLVVTFTPGACVQIDEEGGLTCGGSDVQLGCTCAPNAAQNFPQCFDQDSWYSLRSGCSRNDVHPSE